MDLMKQSYKFDIAACLNQLNREYHQNYTLEDLSKKIGVTAETLNQLSTEGKFCILYTTALEIFDLYPSITSDGNFSFQEILMHMCASDYFYIP